MLASPKCPKCKLFFAWKDTSIDDKAPVLLNCGHALCMLCVTRSQRRIVCSVCKKSELKKKDPSNLKFDIYTIGKCFLHSLTRVQLFEKKLHSKPQNHPNQSNEVKCMECNTKKSTTLCTNCQLSLCHNCCKKIHTDVLSDHKVHATTDEATQLISSDLKLSPTCVVHRRMFTSYCTVDNQHLCEACILMGKHHDHHLLPISQFTQKCVEDLKDLVKDVGVRLISCEQSLNDIKKEMKDLTNEKGQAIRSMQSIFAHFHSLLQHKEADVIEQINDEYSKKIDLQSIQMELFQSQINTMQKLLADIRNMLSREATENIDFDAVFNVIDALKTRPCCVKREDDKGKENIIEEKESVKEICSKIEENCSEKMTEDREVVEDFNGKVGKSCNGEVVEGCNGKVVEVCNGKAVEACSEEVTKDISALNIVDTQVNGESLKQPVCKDTSQEQKDVESAISFLVEKVYLNCPNLTKNISEVSNALPCSFIEQHLADVCSHNPDLQAIMEEKIVCQPTNLIQAHTQHKTPTQPTKNKGKRDITKLIFSFDGYQNPNKYLHKIQPSTSHEQLETYTTKPQHYTVKASTTPPSSSDKTPFKINRKKSLPAPSNEVPADKKAVILPDGLPVQVCHIIDPSNFFIQVLQNIKRIQILEDAIRTLCTSGKVDKIPAIDSVEKESVVLAWSNTKERWMRGRVEEGGGSDASNIFFIDHGHREVVQHDSMYVAPRKHLELPPLAVWCCLVNVAPAGGAWTEEASSLFHEITQDKNFKVKVFERKVDEVVVDLADIEDEVLAGSSLSVRNFLISAGMATKTSFYPCSNTENKQERLPTSAVPQASTMITASICLLKHSSNFFIHLINKNFSKLQKLMGLMQEFYNDLDDSQYSILSPVIGTTCACKSGEDAGWYRAQVLNIEPTKRNAAVRYVDVGKVEKVGFHQLRKLKLQFSKFPAQALLCQLVGETDGCALERLEKWKEQGHVLFYVQSNQNLLSLTFIKCLGHQPVPTYHGDELKDSDNEMNDKEISATSDEPCSSSSLSHNSPASLDCPSPILLQRNSTSLDCPPPVFLQHNSTSLDCPPPIPLQHNSTSLDCPPPIPFQHNSTSLDCPPPILLRHNSTSLDCPPPIPLQHNSTSLDCPPPIPLQHNSTSLDYPPPIPLQHNSTSLDYPPPIPLHDNPALMFLSNIDRHGVLYCHNAEHSHLASLSSMMEALKVLGARSRVGGSADWIKGDIACYCVNDVFYRVRILSLSHKTVEVLLVDFGVVEKVNRRDLRPPLLVDHPVSCYAVTLPLIQWRKGPDGLVPENVTSNVASMIHYKSNNFINLSIQSNIKEDPYNVVGDVFLMDGTQLAVHLHCMKVVI